MQQAKPADSPSQPLKASLANNLQSPQQQQQRTTTTNCTASTQAGAVGERSPRRADESATCAGPENGRLENGCSGQAAGGVVAENGPTRLRQPEGEEDHQQQLREDQVGEEVEEAEEEEEEVLRIKRERLDERIRLSPLREDEGSEAARQERPDRTNDTEGTKVR